jgi:hypothetical protein
MDVERLITYVTAGVAVWGAITGTVALSLQYAQHRRDKSELKLIPKMSIGTSARGSLIDAMEMIDFEIEVINVGRRVARIDEVGISLRRNTGGKGKHGVNLLLFSSKDEEVVTLEEAEKRVFQLARWEKTLEDVAEHFADEETAYVRLTSGRRFEAKFKTVSMSKLAELRRRAQQGAPGDGVGHQIEL